MIHPDLDELGAEPLAPEVLIHLDRCGECRDARAAWVGTEASPDRVLPAVSSTDPFTIVGLLGRGGMGDVYLGRDQTLDREVAIKVLRADRCLPDAESVLVHEARLTARLQHPAIVPIHRVGRLTDGRPFYVMKRAEGRPLRELLAFPIPRRRAVGFVARACDAVAFAHAGGVVHGDLKPENVLIGGFDELTLLDFGLATRIGSPRTTRAGTPPYMAPELRVGAPPSTASDAYALGALLHEVLTGRAPDGLGDLDDVPSPLVAACRAALSPDPDARPDVAELARSLRRWLDGERRTDEARSRLEHAGEALLLAEEARTRARALRRLAEEELAHVPPHEGLHKKLRPWGLLDQADEAEAAAQEADLDRLQALVAALELDPELPEARRELAGYHQARLVDAERRGDQREIRRARRILEANPSTAAWLAAPARVRIRTDPPGARVVAHEPRVEARQWCVGEERDLGPTPVETELPPGRWRIEVHQHERATAVLPLHLAREAELELDLALPEPIAGARWVPPGWFGAGGDEDAIDGLSARRVWLDGFALQVHPVTVGAYVRFLNALPAELAARLQPLETAFGADPRPVLRRSEGDFVPEGLPGDGIGWEPDLPIVLVDYAGATAYAAWWSAETGRTWRLPHDLEREKAARGDDGRTFAWGARLDPAFANMQKSHAGPPRRSPVGEFPLDVSPYGIHGLGGNVRDWCCNTYRREGDAADGEALRVEVAGPDVPWVMVRGGSWTSAENLCRAAARFASPPEYRATSVGFRLACPDAVTAPAGCSTATTPLR